MFNVTNYPCFQFLIFNSYANLLNNETEFQWPVDHSSFTEMWPTDSHWQPLSTPIMGVKPEVNLVGLPHHR